MPCKHKRCRSQVKVVKPHPGDKYGVWMTMIRVKCGDCGVDFRFANLPVLIGNVVPQAGACMSADNLEAFIKIVPVN